MPHGSLPAIGGVDGTVLGNRAPVDLDGDGAFDVGDGIVTNFSEPFTDTNGNGVFDNDPDRAPWLAEDPLSRLTAESAAQIAAQRIYMDVGTKDESGSLLNESFSDGAFGIGGNILDLPRILHGMGKEGGGSTYRTSSRLLRSPTSPERIDVSKGVLDVAVHLRSLASRTSTTAG